MPELIQTLKSIQKTESEKRKFLASIQGIDLNEEKQDEGPTFEDIRRRALGINASGDDIVSLQGQLAEETGFGVGAGLGYFRE
jgi:translation initiation factor 1 (eIF-1/SUI1)